MSAPSWVLRRTPRGFALTAPHQATGEVRVTHVARPAPALRTVLTQWLGALPPACSHCRIGPAERRITRGGEYAALGGARAERPDGAQLEYLVAIVVADDRHCIIEASSDSEAGRTFARAVVPRICDDTDLGLGHPRRRRWLCAPPAQWRELRHGRSTTLLAPAHPATCGRITLWDAVPAADADGLVDFEVQALATELEATPARMRRDFTTQRALRCSMARRERESAALVDVLAVIACDRYRYPLMLTTAKHQEEQHMQALMQVVQTTARLPAPAASHRSIQALAHWSE